MEGRYWDKMRGYIYFRSTESTVFECGELQPDTSYTGYGWRPNQKLWVRVVDGKLVRISDKRFRGSVNTAVNID